MGLRLQVEECEEKLRELAEANGVEPLAGGKVRHPPTHCRHHPTD